MARLVADRDHRRRDRRVPVGARRWPDSHRRGARPPALEPRSPNDCLPRRRRHGSRCRTGPRLHERPGAHGRSAAERRELVIHRRCLRRRLCSRTARATGLDMTAPYFELGYFGARGALVAALIIGIAFGWCLESAGMGSARKLAAKFYLSDHTVVKVMV